MCSSNLITPTTPQLFVQQKMIRPGGKVKVTLTDYEKFAALQTNGFTEDGSNLENFEPILKLKINTIIFDEYNMPQIEDSIVTLYSFPYFEPGYVVLAPNFNTNICAFWIEWFVVNSSLETYTFILEDESLTYNEQVYLQEIPSYIEESSNRLSTYYGKNTDFFNGLIYAIEYVHPDCGLEFEFIPYGEDQLITESVWLGVDGKWLPIKEEGLKTGTLVFSETSNYQTEM